MGNFLSASEPPPEPVVEIDSDPLVTVEELILDDIIAQAGRDFKANQDLMRRALPLVHLIKIRTRETLSRVLMVDCSDGAQPKFSLHVADSELYNSLFIKVAFQEPPGSSVQHCFITANLCYSLYNNTNDNSLVVKNLLNQSSSDIDFIDRCFFYHHSTDDPANSDLPSNCLLHPVCNPEYSIGSNNDAAVVGYLEQKLDMVELGYFDLREIQH